MQKMISNAQDLVQQKQMFINSDTLTDAKLNNTSLYVLFVEQVCCKKQQKKFLTSYWFTEQGTSEGPE